MRVEERKAQSDEGTNVARAAFKMSIFDAAAGGVVPTHGEPRPPVPELPPPSPSPDAGPAQARRVERQMIPAPDDGQPKVNDSGRGAIIGGLVVFVLFFGVIGLWSVMAPLEGATTAPGQVIVEASRSPIQHIEGGLVRAVHVKEGDQVSAGQLLIELDDTNIRATVNVLSQQSDALRAQAARLTAELQGAAGIQFPQDLLDRTADPEVRAALDGQQKLFVARRQILTAQVSGMQKRIDELTEQIRGARAQIRARTLQRQSYAAELESIRALVESGVITRSRQIDLDRNLQRIQGEEEDIIAKVAVDGQTIEQIKHEITQVQSERVGQTAAELRDVQNRIADVQQRLHAARDVLDHTRIPAPVTGTVLAPVTYTPGSVIARGEKVMEIVPNVREYMVEAYIRVDDIAHVHVNMRTEVKLTAFKQRNLTVIDGSVLSVSADRIVDPRSGIPHYVARVRVDEKGLAANPQVSLYPGMPVTVYIPTGERTAFDYIMAPILESLSSAFREP